MGVGVFGDNVEEGRGVGRFDAVELEHANHFFAAVVESERAEVSGIEGQAVEGEDGVEVDGLMMIEEKCREGMRDFAEQLEVEDNAGGGNAVGAVEEIL